MTDLKRKGRHANRLLCLCCKQRRVKACHEQAVSLQLLHHIGVERAQVHQRWQMLTVHGLHGVGNTEEARGGLCMAKQRLAGQQGQGRRAMNVHHGTHL